MNTTAKRREKTTLSQSDSATNWNVVLTSGREVTRKPRRWATEDWRTEVDQPKWKDTIGIILVTRAGSGLRTTPKCITLTLESNRHSVQFSCTSKFWVD